MPSFFITGTDTGVGKTFITALLTNILQSREQRVAVYKPVETGGKYEHPRYISNDMSFIKKMSKLPQGFSEMNTYCFSNAVAPSLAAEMEDKTISLDLIKTDFKHLQEHYDCVLVEGAGGICVPVCGTEILIADLVKLVDLPMLVVARPDLGTINHTVLTVKYAQSLGLKVAGVIINHTCRIEETVVEKTNPHYIEGITGIPVLGVVPYLDINEQNCMFSNAEAFISYEKILRCCDEFLR